MVLVFHARMGLMKGVMKRKEDTFWESKRERTRGRERERVRERVSVNKSAKRVKDKHYKWDKRPAELMFIIIRTLPHCFNVHEDVS